MLTLLLAACATPTGDPAWIAWRGGAAHWPADSLLAAEAALDAGVDGVHLDVALTADRAAVLLPESPGALGCTADADDLPTWAWSLDDLRSEWTCGGTPDPDFPNAVLAEAPPAALDDLLPMLRTAPGAARLVLELAWSADVPAEEWGPPVLDGLLAADVPPELVVMAHTPLVLDAVRAHAASLGRDVTTWLVVPSDLVPSAANGLAPLEGIRDWDELADRAGVDGLVVRWDDAWPRRLADAEAEVVVRSPERADVHALLAEWPATGVLTAHPGHR